MSRRGAIALGVGALFLAGLVVWTLTYTSLFSARHIRVTGNRRLTDQQVREVAQVSSATNVAHLDTGSVVDRLRADPWIASADVSVRWPSTLVLSVEERKVVGVIEGLGNRWLLASDGSELPMTDPPLGGLPVVRAGLAAPDPSQRAAAATLLDALSRSLVSRVDEIIVAQGGDVTIRLTGGVSIDAGVAGREQDKAGSIDAVLRWATARNIGLRSIDVSSPSAPAVTLADGSTVTP